ncbi:hypothetical protein DFJ73DRAFT_870921, partial [Zopfochytrium polystomum]
LRTLPGSPPPLSTRNHTTTQCFLFHIVMHSQSTFYDLQLALYYLSCYRARTRKAALSSSEKGPIVTSIPPRPADLRERPLTPPPDTVVEGTGRPDHAPAPRLAFLACLVLAWKHLHDDPHTTQTWSSFSGEPAALINAAERTVLCGLGHRLHVGMVCRGCEVGGAGFEAFCRAAVRIAEGIAQAEFKDRESALDGWE